MGWGAGLNSRVAVYDSYDGRIEKKMPLPELSRKVSTYFEIEEKELRSPIKKRSVTQAKSVFGYLSIRRMGYSGIR